MQFSGPDHLHVYIFLFLAHISFQKMAGDTGVMRCTIPQGRKDGKKVKGNAFDRIVGVGALPGEEYAALNVLHQMEHGKPFERLLAPEFRGVWLDLDKRFAEVQEEQSQRAANRERRQQQAERRARFEKANESATINISAASRQMIEDALLEQKATITNASGAVQGKPSSSDPRQLESKKRNVKDELASMGFSELDAKDASQRFATITDAIDYLCLNLDEAELPPSFAPTSDVEVVQFYSGSGKQARGLVDLRSTEILTRMLCLSKHAAQKALRLAEGEMDRAMGLLYNTLTHNCLAEEFFIPRADGVLRLSQEEKILEAESTMAIYGEDAMIGVGKFPAIENRWAAVIRREDGFPQIGYTGSISIAIVDVDGFYPFSAPLVVIFSAHDDSSSDKRILSASRRRVLMRAAAGEIMSLRKSYGTRADNSPDSLTPVPVVHAILSFLCDATEEEVMSSAAGRESSYSQSNRPIASRIKNRTTGAHSSKTVRITTTSTKVHKQRTDQPLRVEKLKGSPELSDMQARRAMLPAHHSRAKILANVKRNQVVVISGATGSGKTTQVPQYLLEEAATSGDPISIVCTQPRRIAAMSVAERVAAERCQKVGDTVGYQVKLNAQRSKNTRLLFCTTGVLLRRLQSDPQLESLTHILVDEVHERSVETDFLLLLLRDIATNRPSLRIVLMSATLDAKKFSNYFASALASGKMNVHVPIISIPGRTFPVEELYLEEAVQKSQYSIMPGSRYAKRVGKTAHIGKYGFEPREGISIPRPRNSATAAAGRDDIAMDDERHNLELGTKCGFQDVAAAETTVGRHFPSHPDLNEKQAGAEAKRTIALLDESVVNPDLIEKLVRRIDMVGRNNQEYGAILIFLPGMAEISGVLRKLSTGTNAQELWPLPLHSLLSPDDQRKVFSKPPHGKRKVICATNIAETSITVEDVTVVIDTLRAKEMSYDSLNRASVLAEGFISKAAAKQRAGRAGRVSKGTCYRLVRRHTFENRLAAQQAPEIQRVALEQLVLHMLSIIPKEQSKNDPLMVLGKAVDPPDRESITTAISNLIDIGALKQTANAESTTSQLVELTALGRHLTGLPVDARIGKLLIFGSLFGCVDAVLTIAATIAERSPFYAPFDKREEARAARALFVWGKSDLLTFVKAFDAWRELRESRPGFTAENEFCSTHFLSRKTLISISDGRKQLADALADAGFGLPNTGRSERGWERHAAVNQYNNNVRVVKAVVCAALYPNVARIDLPDSTYYEVAGGTVANEHEARKIKLRSKTGERLFLHPGSVNFHECNYESRWLAYNAKIKTTKMYVRDSTMVSPYAILLFGGEIAVQHKKGQMSVDGWVIFKAPARVAVLARELRRQLDSLLLRKFEDADIDLNEEGRAVKDAIIRLITTES